MIEPELVDFYKDKKIVVTGGCGFVGHKLVRLLLAAGGDVTVLDDQSRGTNMVIGAGHAIDDASDQWICENYFEGADIVFNLAASVAGVLHNQSHHLDMYMSNLGLQTAPVVAAARVGVENFAQVSSVCVYSPEHNAPSEEKYGLSGTPHPANAGYAEAKRDGERALLWSSGIGRAVIVRPSNIIGTHDYFDEKAHVVPALFKRAVETKDGDTFTLYGPATTTREFIYSDDVAKGMMYVMAFGEDKEAYNLGTNGTNVVTMYTLATQILEIVGRKNVRVIADASVGGGDSKRFSDSTKAQALGWRHKVPLFKALQEIYDWYEGWRPSHGFR